MSKTLKAAIEANDPQAVRAALKGVKDINRKLPGADKPLLYACRKGADRVLEVLFAAGAVAEKRHTFPGDTPFAVAAEHRQFQVMKRLLELKQASDEAVRHVLEIACMDGKADVLEFLLKETKPPVTIELFRLGSVRSNAPEILKLLVKHGGDLRARHDTNEAKGMTPLHDLAAHGRVEVIRTLLQLGADVNARDELGRTPLMVLAASLEGIEVGNRHAKIVQKSLACGKATLLAGGVPQVADGLAAVRTLLEARADASVTDHAGNDAIDHCAFEYFRSDETPDPKLIGAMRQAGAKGSESTLDLFKALKQKDPAAVRAAIRKGADVNRLTPPPVSFTPLTWASASSEAEALGIVEALLEAKADPNQSAQGATPLIRAARSGNLLVVKTLIAAGADIHSVYESRDFIENAYSAAEGHDELRDYLKSLGAVNPKRARSEPFKLGVASWNDFSELLVKTTAPNAAKALAKLIGGQAQSEVYGQTLMPGKRAFVVVRPKGMDWCNVFQVAPPRLRYEDSKNTEALAVELARAANAPVLFIEYSDTSDAASVFRVEADGTSSRDEGWDHDMLEEMVGAMGDEAPAWAKKQLARSDEDDLRSTERLELLAQQEKFVLAAFGFYCEPGRKLEVEVTGYGAEAFDGAAFVGS